MMPSATGSITANGVVDSDAVDKLTGGYPFAHDGIDGGLAEVVGSAVNQGKHRSYEVAAEWILTRHDATVSAKHGSITVASEGLIDPRLLDIDQNATLMTGGSNGLSFSASGDKTSSTGEHLGKNVVGDEWVLTFLEIPGLSLGGATAIDPGRPATQRYIAPQVSQGYPDRELCSEPEVGWVINSLPLGSIHSSEHQEGYQYPTQAPFPHALDYMNCKYSTSIPLPPSTSTLFVTNGMHLLFRSHIPLNSFTDPLSTDDHV